MKKAKKAENPIRKIIGICLILLFVMGVGVMASNAKLYNVKIILSNGYIMNVTTSKTKVSEILDENHIILLPEESVIPNEDSELSDNKTIKISKDEQQTVEVAENAETSENVTVETLLKTYDSIVEKLETVQVTIPYETITKDVSNNDSNKRETVVQKGKDGLKEVTYKVKYQNDVEIERTQISETVVQEPVNKIVQVTAQVSSRYAVSRNLGASSASAAEAQAYARERCTAYGWSENDYYNLVSLWNKESHWNMYAQNSRSGAYGIPQALPGSKMASAGSDYLTNYKTQVNWGLSYIKGRYGNPTMALYHSQATGWY